MRISQRVFLCYFPIICSRSSETLWLLLFSKMNWRRRLLSAFGSCCFWFWLWGSSTRVELNPDDFIQLVLVPSFWVWGFLDLDQNEKINIRTLAAAEKKIHVQRSFPLDHLINGDKSLKSLFFTDTIVVVCERYF